MKTLAIEFSSGLRSVAILFDGVLRAESSEGGGRDTHPFALIQSALAEAAAEREEVECLLIGLGPGSYAGIRQAIAIAQGWQLARGVKLLGIGSVDCVALAAWQDGIFGRLAVVVDAQQGEYYVAAYESAPPGIRPAGTPRLASPNDVHEHARAGSIIVGPEADRVLAGGRRIFPRASLLGSLARGRSDFVPGHQLQPFYHRATAFVRHTPSVPAQPA
jgi:tRNA threonylcarbamoyl adenosine modification protein YeaZ